MNRPVMLKKKIPEKFSLLGMYGNFEIFRRRQEEGYTEVVFGSGEWVSSERIIALWAFYGPNKLIATYQHPKYDDGLQTRRGSPFERIYNEEEFRDYLKRMKISLGSCNKLSDIVSKWSE